MLNITDGQCGSCSHFGGGIPEEQLVQIRVNHTAQDDVVGGCDLDSNASIHLKVSPIGSCDRYEAA
ncbi:MAG: hypothetical protein MK101_02630 [Phycisphaerales bacterium]|nr:hypothetical protein [Phycisphaerales bacterium]